METAKEERFSNLRLEQAMKVGAEVLATSCPYCITMLEDSCNVMGKGDQLKVIDLSELIERRHGSTGLSRNCIR